MLGACALINASCDSGSPPVVDVVAETTIEDPDVLFTLDGDYVAPGSHRFVVEGFRRFHSSEVREEKTEAIVISDRAWINDNGEWSETAPDDPEIVDISTPGTMDFWMDFDFRAELQGMKGPEERVNGIDSQRISIRSPELAAEVLGIEEDRVKGLDEFTIWLAKDGGWPVALRLVISGGQYPFQTRSGVDDNQKLSAQDLPPDVFESYHYDFVVASERVSATASEDTYGTEMIFALSRVNDPVEEIKPPR